jgi:Domain of unknown function (DUF932)
MPASIFGERFYGARGKAAWHNQGFVDDLEHTASDAFDLIGRYSVHKLPLITAATRQDGTHIETPAFGLIRGPVADDPKEAYFGTVSADYNLVDPDQFAKLWDERVRRPVETMLALKDGRQLIITVKLPAFDVRGDEIENYAMAWNLMDGSTASGANVASVRVVCANTFAASLAASQQKVSFRHDSFIQQRMGRWMEDAIERAEAKLPELAEAYDVLAAYTLTRARPESPREIKHVLTAAYPQLPQYVPDPLLGDEQNEERAKRRASEIRIVDERRVQALELFKGAGTGMRNRASWGTMWGLYQSVAELEDWKGGSKGDGLAHSVLYGERAQTKARAFEAAMAVAAGKADVG